MVVAAVAVARRSTGARPPEWQPVKNAWYSRWDEVESAMWNMQGVPDDAQVKGSGSARGVWPGRPSLTGASALAREHLEHLDSSLTKQRVPAGPHAWPPVRIATGGAAEDRGGLGHSVTPCNVRHGRAGAQGLPAAAPSECNCRCGSLSGCVAYLWRGSDFTCWMFTQVST